MAYFSYESRELLRAEDKEPGADDPVALPPPREGLVPDEAEADEPETGAMFCDEELLVNVLKAFIHLVFMPLPPLPPLPPDIKLNLLPRLLSCWSDEEPPDAAATSAMIISALDPYRSRWSRKDKRTLRTTYGTYAYSPPLPGFRLRQNK